MNRIEKDDIVTYWFITTEFEGKRKIQAWSPEKELAKFYIEFHGCPDFELKKIEKPLKDMNIIIYENMHDKIHAGNIKIKSKNKKKGWEMMYIPITKGENRIINEESDSLLGSYIDYNILNQAVPFLKKKYRKALGELFLESILKFNIKNEADKYNQSIELDQLKVLFRAFPESFG